MEEATFLQELCSPGFHIFCYYYHHSSCSVGLAYACHHQVVVAIPPCYPLGSRGRLVSCSFITHEHMAFKAMNKCLETPLALLRPLVETYAFVCASGHRGWIVNLALDVAGHRGWTVDLAVDAAGHCGWTVDLALDAAGHCGWMVDLALDATGHSAWIVNLALDAAGHCGWTVDIALDLERGTNHPWPGTPGKWFSLGHSEGGISCCNPNMESGNGTIRSVLRHPWHRLGRLLRFTHLYAPLATVDGSSILPWTPLGTVDGRSTLPWTPLDTGWTVDLVLDAAGHWMDGQPCPGRRWALWMGGQPCPGCCWALWMDGRPCLDLVLDVGPIIHGLAHQAKGFLWVTARGGISCCKPHMESGNGTIRSVLYQIRLMHQTRAFLHTCIVLP